MGSARLSELLPGRAGRDSGGGQPPRLPGLGGAAEEIRLLRDAGYLVPTGGDAKGWTLSPLGLAFLGRVATSLRRELDEMRPSAPRAVELGVCEHALTLSYGAGDEEELRHVVRAVRDAIMRTLLPTGGRFSWVQADAWRSGGEGGPPPAAAGGMVADLHWLTDAGKTVVLRCPHCGAAGLPEHIPVVEHTSTAAPNAPVAVPVAAPVAALADVPTPGATTIAKLCAALGVGPEQTIKTMFFRLGPGRMGPRVVAAVLRGDRDVSPAKLARCFEPAKGGPAQGAPADGNPGGGYPAGDDVALATHEDLARAGVPVGFASPVGLGGIPLVIDNSIEPGVPYVAGANRPDFHTLNVVFGRDFPALWSALAGATAGDGRSDIAAARGGDPCPVAGCQGRLEPEDGLLLGRMHAICNESCRADVRLDPALLLAACVSANRDAFGIAWPAEVAPFQIQMLAIGREEEVRLKAEGLFAKLDEAALSVLYDDRETGPGVKLKDADLMGMPLRLVISSRTLAAGGAEFKPRRPRVGEVEAVPAIVALGDLPELLAAR